MFLNVLRFLVFLYGYCFISSAQTEEKIFQEVEDEKIEIIKDYQKVHLRILEKETGMKKDVLLTPDKNEKTVFSLDIKCYKAFVEKVNPSLYVLWAYLEVTQQDHQGEKHVVYSDWYNNLKPVFENPDFDLELMDVT